MSKYKYYLHKPRSEIGKDILKAVALTGIIVVAAQSPYFIPGAWRAYRAWRQHPRKKFHDTFSRLWKSGYLSVQKDGYDLKITLTEKGKCSAGWLQIDALKIAKPRRWDGRWRLVIFDIAELKRRHRDALRAKLKGLGFKRLQQSAWVHPYPCRDELDLLRDFFGFKPGQMIAIEASRINDEQILKQLFKLQP